MKASTNIDFTISFPDLCACAWHWFCICCSGALSWARNSLTECCCIKPQVHTRCCQEAIPLLVSWEEYTHSFARQCLITVKKSKSGQRSLLPAVVWLFLGGKLLQLHPALGQAELQSLVLSFFPSAGVFPFPPLCCGVSFPPCEKLPAVQCWEQVHYMTAFRETAPAAFTHRVRRQP